MKWPANGNLVLTGVLSAAAGAAVGFLVSAKIQEKKLDERLEVEIQKTREFYQEMYSRPQFVEVEKPVDDETLLERVKDATDAFDGSPRDLVGEALEATRNYQGRDDQEEQDERTIDRQAPVIVNIFDKAVVAGEEVLEALKESRDPSEPYIITREEFLQNEPEYEQLEFTYWVGDHILVDDREEYQPVDSERVAGDENLARFGYGSGDEHVLYIRNEAGEMDLHITKSTGKYEVEVMAEDPSSHLEHSHPRKFRLYDE